MLSMLMLVLKYLVAFLRPVKKYKKGVTISRSFLLLFGFFKSLQITERLMQAKYLDGITYKNVRKLTILNLYIMTFYDFYLFHYYENISKFKKRDFY